MALARDTKKLEALVAEKARRELLHAQDMERLDAEIDAERARLLNEEPPKIITSRAEYDEILKEDREASVWWTRLLLPDPLAPLPTTKAMREVATVIAELGGEATLAQIADKLGIDTSAAGVRLGRVVQLGIVERVRPGTFRLPDRLPEGAAKSSNDEPGGDDDE